MYKIQEKHSIHRLINTFKKKILAVGLCPKKMALARKIPVMALPYTQGKGEGLQPPSPLARMPMTIILLLQQGGFTIYL